MVSFHNSFPNYSMSTIFDEEATVPAAEGEAVATPEVEAEAAPAVTEEAAA